MTFNKMRFPIVWITFALCVILVPLVQSGPIGNNKDFDQDLVRLVRQAEVYEEEDVSTEDEVEETQKLNFPAPSQSDENGSEEGDEGRSLQRSVRDVSEKLVVEEETSEQSVIPGGVVPVVPEKKPSVLELLSSALDKALEATSKIPTQQVASDAAGVFQILGQVFTEAIDKVIGDDDALEENTEVPTYGNDNKIAEEPSLQPLTEEPIKVNQETSQSDKEDANKL